MNVINPDLLLAIMLLGSGSADLLISQPVRKFIDHSTNECIGTSFQKCVIRVIILGRATGLTAPQL